MNSLLWYEQAFLWPVFQTINVTSKRFVEISNVNTTNMLIFFFVEKKVKKFYKHMYKGNWHAVKTQLDSL